MPAIDPIFVTTAPIFRFMDAGERGIATGFFFLDDEEHFYLVTNKHVIYGDKYYEDPNPEINIIKLRIHINPQNLSQNEEITIELFDGENKKWLEHTDQDVDVVLIPINIDRQKYVITPINKSFIETSNIEVGFEKIFVMGYPYGWYDTHNNLPVARVGHLSSPFKVPFQGRPILLGDVETHRGMSGGPVFMKLQDYTTVEGINRTTHLGAQITILVGIHSGQPRWDLIDKEQVR